MARRWGDGGFEYLVEWAPMDNGDPWDDTWEPENFISKALLDAYKSKLALSKMVTVDVAPLVHLVRKKVAHAVATAKTQCRPREHDMPLECLALQVIALAFLELVRSPTAFSLMDCKEGEGGGHLKLPLLHTIDEDGVETWQVDYLTMEHVGAFCAFQSFLNKNQGVGALRYEIGRDSNTDYMVVGVPMCFKVSANRKTGVVSSSVEFVTCYGNGMYGTLEKPHQYEGMLLESKHFNSVLAYAKKYLPPYHTLAKKGWKELPGGVHTMAADVSVPVAPVVQ